MIQEPEKFPLWKRFLTGSLAMVLVGASVASLWAFSQREDIAQELQDNQLAPSISRWLDGSASGPQTIMLLGSDRRKGGPKGDKPRSDTMMLVRLDPDLNVTSVLSLPRDLKVDIPGYRNNAKLNEAFSAGGPKLALRTIKDLTGLKVNHVVNIDFKGFRQAVDRIGCVYIDVDRRYYNSNANRYVGDQYAEINLKPGYQRLCGQKALDFVRYRHEDNDIVRGARQQAFLRQARQQVGVQQLFGSAKDLKRIIAKNTRTDASLAQGKTLQRVLTLGVRSAGKPIVQVPIPNLEFKTIGGASYVVASNDSMRAAARRFLNGPKVKERAAPTTGATPGTSKPIRRRSQKGVSAKGLVKDVSGGRQQGLRATQGTSMKIFYPTLRLASAVYQQPRSYKIYKPDGKRANSYRIVARLTSGDQGQYYGIQGTTWLDAPILKNPTEERKIRGRTLQLYFEGNKLGLVAWRKGKAVYWVSNTLSRTLSSKQMLGIAASLKRLGR